MSFQFLSRVRTLTRNIDIANLSVCLSDRPSVRPSVCPHKSYSFIVTKVTVYI